MFPIIQGVPERIFGVDGISPPGSEMEVRARTRRWPEGAEGDAPVGVLGVLADNATGYAVIAGGAPGYWSVTTELSLDVFNPIPTDGSILKASASLVHSNGSIGFSDGQVLDSRGGIVAGIRQRGLYILGYPASPRHPTAEVAPDSKPDGLDDMFGAFNDRVHLPVTRSMVNPMGNLHGGVGLCLVEWASSRAFREGSGEALRTIGVHVVYLRAAPLGTRLRVNSEVVHRGRSLGSCRVAVCDDAGRLLLEATVTAGAA